MDERVSETIKQEAMIVLIVLINKGQSSVRLKNGEMLNTCFFFCELSVHQPLTLTY